MRHGIALRLIGVILRQRHRDATILERGLRLPFEHPLEETAGSRVSYLDSTHDCRERNRDGKR
jgi:hypothetical protein